MDRNCFKKDIMSRLRSITLLGAGAIVMLGLGGCGTLGNLFGGGSKVKKETVLPSDREEIQLQATHQEYSSEDLAKGVVKGDWAIEEVAGKPTVGVTAPYLKFVPSEKRVYGNNGCNVLNATYQYNPADSTISFGQVATTMRMCDKAGLTEIDINSALANVKHYTWERKGNEYYLYLKDNRMQPLLTLMHQNFEFLNGTWQVITIDDESINNPDVKLVIDVDEGKIHGNTGCNILNGTFDIDMETANAISFQDLVTTRMACPNPEYETRFIVALEAADHAKPISEDRVLLLNSANEVVLTLQRLSAGIGEE